MATVWSILLFLDGAIYDLICFLYDIFDYLSTLNIFKEADYQGIVNRVYIILGLIMLFVLAYSLLRAVINPDEFAKGETSFPNLIKNVVVSLVIIVILPTAFTVVFNIQNSILNNDVIPKLILDEYSLNEENGNGGRLIAFYTFEAFLFPDIDYCDSLGFDDLTVCRMSAGELKGNDGWFGQWGDHITKTDDGVLNQDTSFTWYSNYSELVRDGKLKYYFPISTAAGIFILWVMANFCFDMAIRVIKLAFYQIIAPIPVVCRILPGGKMKDVFSNWVRQVISIFAEVFIRIGAMTIGVYLINIIVEMFTGAKGRYLPNISSLNWAQKPIAMALLIMGAVIFIKQVPKILGDLLKLDTGGMKLGLMDKLAMGGGLLAGAAVGGLATSGIRNLVNGAKNTRQNFLMARAQGKRGVGAIAGGVWNTAKSTIGGAASGMVRAGYAGKGAKSLKDMKGAASKGIAGATKARDKRALYKANHGGTLRGAVAGHVMDTIKETMEWSGVSPSLVSLKEKQQSIDYVNSSLKELEDSARNLIVSDANKNKSKTYDIRNHFASSNRALQTQIATAAGINVANYDTAVLRQLEQAKAAATASGGHYAGISIADWENMISEYTDKFSKEVVNQGLLDEASISAFSVDTRNDLKDVIINGTKVRGALQDTMTSSFVKNAGIDPSFIDKSNSIDINSAQISNLKSNLKQESTDVGIAIAQKRNEESQKNSDGK